MNSLVGRGVERHRPISRDIRRTKTQQGAVLIVCLLFLLVLSLSSSSSVQSNILQSRMANNYAERERALQAAEAGLLDGAAWIQGLREDQIPTPDSTGSQGVFRAGALQSSFTDYDFPWNSIASEYGNQTQAPLLSNVAYQPRWVVEFEGAICDDMSGACREGRGRAFYRITARGTGSNSQASAVVQAVMQKRYR